MVLAKLCHSVTLPASPNVMQGNRLSADATIPTTILVVMGVSGTGKSTLGRALADALQWQFLEGDDFHPEDNIRRMRNGEPLKDEHRWPWLQRLHDALVDCQQSASHCVLSCSALKKSHRRKLVQQLTGIEFVYLCGEAEMILQRLRQRGGHFMPPELLDSQLAALEPPREAIFVPIDLSTRDQVAVVRQQLAHPTY